MKQLNSIMEILGDERTRTEYIEKISNVKEVIVCSSCNTKNRVQKNKKSKCGKCKQPLYQEEFINEDIDTFNNLRYKGYFDEITDDLHGGAILTIGMLKNEPTLCFIAISEQSKTMIGSTLSFLTWVFIAYILSIISSNIFDSVGSLWHWVILGVDYLIIAPFLTGLIFWKNNALGNIQENIKEGNLTDAIEECELMSDKFEKDNQLRLVYANALYILAHYTESSHTQKHLFERAIGLVDVSTDVGHPKLGVTTLLFLADLYEKATTVFNIQIRDSENEVKTIIERYKMKITSEEAKTELEYSIHPWRV